MRTSPRKTIWVVILFAIILSTISATAGDLSGKWSGTFKVNGGDHTVPQLFVLKQQGELLTGSGGPNAGEQYPIEQGTIAANRIRFELTTGEWKFTYDLRQAGTDTLDGDLKLQSVGEERTAKVSLARVKSD